MISGIECDSLILIIIWDSESKLNPFLNSPYLIGAKVIIDTVHCYFPIPIVL